MKRCDVCDRPMKWLGTRGSDEVYGCRGCGKTRSISAATKAYQHDFFGGVWACCAVCSKPMRDARADRKTCSDRCRKALQRRGEE